MSHRPMSDEEAIAKMRLLATEMNELSRSIGPRIRISYDVTDIRLISQAYPAPILTVKATREVIL